MNLWQPGKGEIGLMGEGQDREKGEREDRDRHSMGALGDLGSPFCWQRYIRGCTTVQPLGGTSPSVTVLRIVICTRPLYGASPSGAPPRL
jgi:hypothetical protein